MRVTIIVGYKEHYVKMTGCFILLAKKGNNLTLFLFGPHKKKYSLRSTVIEAFHFQHSFWKNDTPSVPLQESRLSRTHVLRKKVFEYVINKYCSECWDPLLIECPINKCCSGCWNPLLTLFYQLQWMLGPIFNTLQAFFY